MEDTTNSRFCNPWLCNKGSHNTPLEELNILLQNNPIESVWQHLPLVALYVKKLASILVTQLIKENNKYDLYLRFGKKWQVSLVGHMWPEDLVTINTILAKEDFAQQHSIEICKWMEKNLTVSTDPDFMKINFDYDYVRAKATANLAKSKQTTSKTLFLPSAICFAVQPIGHKLREAMQPWKNNAVRLVKENIPHSHPSYTTGNPHIDALLDLHDKAVERNDPFEVTEIDEDSASDINYILIAHIFKCLKNSLPPGHDMGELDDLTDLGEFLTNYHYCMAIAYSDSDKPVFLYKRMPCEMEMTPYSPLILEAVASPVVFNLQTDPNKDDNPFKPVILQSEISPTNTLHPELSTWTELGPLTFFMDHVENFKISWSSEEVVVLNVSSKDTKFRKASATDEEKEDIFISEKDNKFVRTSNL